MGMNATPVKHWLGGCGNVPELREPGGIAPLGPCFNGLAFFDPINGIVLRRHGPSRFASSNQAMSDGIMALFKGTQRGPRGLHPPSRRTVTAEYNAIDRVEKG